MLSCRLSATAGVDFLALREKYSAIAAKRPIVTAREPGIEATDREKIELEGHARLDKLIACHVCHGSGIEKYVYNFSVREQNCSKCDGEGVVQRFALTSESPETQRDAENSATITSGTDSVNPPPLS